MIEFKESKFYKLLQDFFINNNKETFLQMLAEFYNRTEGIINKNINQDELIKELRNLYLEFNEKGIDENIVREKVDYFVENNGKIKDILAKLVINTNKIEDIKTKLNTNTSNIENITSQLGTNTNNIKNISSQLDNIAYSPLSFGAKGDGVTDDTQALTLANNKNGNVYISNGIFRISSNLTLGNLTFSNNGSIIVDSGVTLIISSVNAENSNIIFKGLGTVKITNNNYSVGWYDGNSLNEKWDFCRKGFTKDERKNVIIPVPSENDKAKASGVYQNNAWSVTAPLKFNDPENEMNIDFKATLVATSSTESVIEIGGIDKPEEITFNGTLSIEGGGILTQNAGVGINLKGGSRIIFNCPVKVKHCRDYGVIISDVSFNLSENYFNFLEVTGFSKAGCLISGGVNGNTFCKINYLFTNGGYLGCDSLLRIDGKVRALSVNKIIENGAYQLQGFSDFSTSLIYIRANSAGGSRNININNLYMNNSTVTGIKFASTSSNYSENITIDNVFSNLGSTLIDLDKVKNVTITNVKEIANSILISDCENIKITGTPTLVSGGCKGLNINGDYYFKFSLAQDTVKVIELPTNVINGNISTISQNDGGGSFFGLLRSGGAYIDVYKGSAINVVTSSALNGTTGVTNKISISYHDNKFYIENRLPTSINFYVSVKGL